MNRLIISVAVCGLMLQACVGDPGTRVDWGGVMSPAERPEETSPCYEAGWAPVLRPSPRYPSELFTFLRLAQIDRDERRFVLSYDISEDGNTRNIRFVEPERYLEHAATQSAVLAAAQAVAQWRFEPGEEPVYATGCITEFNFSAG